MKIHNNQRSAILFYIFNKTAHKSLCTIKSTTEGVNSPPPPFFIRHDIIILQKKQMGGSIWKKSAK